MEDLLIVGLFCLSTCYAAIPSIPLYNAADADLRMPVVGLGTYGYNRGGAPEKWNYTTGYNTALQWFSVGGRRWDSAYSYKSKEGVADGLVKVTNNYTTTPRSEIFITNKIGEGGSSLGYNETLQQFENLTQMFQTSYMDLLLIHWPSFTNGSTNAKSSDPTCNSGDDYNPSICRQNTWRAMEKIYKGYKMDNGLFVRSRAIGVSNFEQNHIMDIFNLNSLFPSVNQIEFHGYWHEFELVEWCQRYNILINSYAPLGAPDVTTGNWDPVLTKSDMVVNMGNKYNKTGAQVWLRWSWQQNIVFNPRSENTEHMKENMDVFDFELNENEMLQLSSLTPPQYPDNKVCPDPNTRP